MNDIFHDYKIKLKKDLIIFKTVDLSSSHVC